MPTRSPRWQPTRKGLGTRSGRLQVIESFLGFSQIGRTLNYAQQVDPIAKPKSNPEANSANNNYASILMYIQQNPSKSLNFIKDIKDKFFEDSCKVKSNIDFANIASMPGGLPFSSD